MHGNESWRKTLRGGETAARGWYLKAVHLTEKSVTRMVLSKQPGHKLESPPEAAQQRILQVDAGMGQGHFEPRVRGAWERDSGMSSSRIGRRSEPSHLIHSVLRAAAGAMLLMLALASVPAHAQSAKAWDKRGQTAEAREDYDAAFEAYRQAHLKKPKDLRYKTRYERLRFQAANMHVDRGRVLRNSGDSDGALNEFARALQIDPGNQAAAQELQITEKPKDGSAPTGGSAPGAPGIPAPGSHQAE